MKGVQKYTDNWLYGDNDCMDVMRAAVEVWFNENQILHPNFLLCKMTNTKVNVSNLLLRGF